MLYDLGPTLLQNQAIWSGSALHKRAPILFVFIFHLAGRFLFPYWPRINRRMTSVLLFAETISCNFESFITFYVVLIFSHWEFRVVEWDVRKTMAMPLLTVLVWYGESVLLWRSVKTFPYLVPMNKTCLNVIVSNSLQIGPFMFLFKRYILTRGCVCVCFN